MALTTEGAQAEAASWKRWNDPAVTWDNTTSGAHTHGFESGVQFAQEQYEADRKMLRLAIEAQKQRAEQAEREREDARRWAVRLEGLLAITGV